MKAQTKRNEAVSKAKDYARAGKWYMMMIWLDRAHSYWPVSALQLYYVRKLIGPYKYEELNLDKLLEKDYVWPF